MNLDFIYGGEGICNAIEKLRHENYGKDLELALFEFHVKPTSTEVEHLKEIRSYRKNEKSIGIPITVNDENFFNKSKDGRYEFLKQAIFQKLDLLAEVVKKKKLDTNMELLKSDLHKVLE